MKLSRSDWVLLGSGHLYSAPFVSRHLLFRLFDIDRSLLFSEEPGAETSHTTLEKDEQKRILRIQSVPRKAKTIHLYSSSSATVALEELSKSTPIEIPLEDFRQEVVIDGILMTLTPCQLPSSRAHVLSTGEDQPVSYEIAETFYKILTPKPLRHFPELVRHPLDHVFTSHLHLSVLNTHDDRCYNYASNQKWSLAALCIAHEWRPYRQAILQRAED